MGGPNFAVHKVLLQPQFRWPLRTILGAGQSRMFWLIYLIVRHCIYLSIVQRMEERKIKENLKSQK